MLSIQTQQVLLPKKVYIGDSAELRVSFSSSAEFTETGSPFLRKALNVENFTDSEKSETQEISGYFSDSSAIKDYVINGVQLIKDGIDHYQLSVYFVPWKTGNISLPSYTLVSKTGDEFLINFEQVNIVSLLERNAQGSYSTELQGGTGPLLLPGTIYKLWGASILFVILIIVLIRCLVKRKEIAFHLKNKKLLRKYKKNASKTVRLLNELLENSKNPEGLKKGKKLLSDKEFAAEIQKIMRNYLEVRFEFPFNKTVSSQIMNAFNEATCGLASDEKINAAVEVAGVFTRTDFIRYSAGGAFLENEKIHMIENLKKNIQIFEKTESDKKSDSNNSAGNATQKENTDGTANQAESTK